MEWAFLSIDLIIPLILVAFGLSAKKVALGRINFWIGYRSARSVASREAWEFANLLAGKVMLWEGLSQLVLSLLFGILALILCPVEVQGSVCTALTLLQTISLIIAIPCIEKQLQQKFD